MPDALPKDLLSTRLEDWYRGVNIDLTGDLLEARRQAIEAISEDLTIDSAPDIVAYAHGRKEFGPVLIDWIVEHGQAFDTDFTPKAGDVEPRVMTACAIANHLVNSSTSRSATTYSLLVHSAAFRGYRTAARSQNLLELASRQIEFAASREKVAPAATQTTAVAVEKSLEGLQEPPPSAGGDESGLTEWLAGLRTACKALARRQDRLERTLSRTFAVSREETNQIAWLLDAHCELGNRPWAEMKEAAVLMSGAELAEITSVPSLAQAGVMIRSTLLKAGRNPEQTTKALTAVQKAAALLDRWPENQGHLLLPISASIDAWRERGRGNGGWRGLAKEKRGGGDLAECSEAELADQAFREFLIARRLDDERG
jgi:hypothetical protein